MKLSRPELRRLAAVLTLGSTLVATISTAGAQQPPQPTALTDRPAYAAAVGALRENRPALAAEKLDQLIEAAENLAPADAETVRLLRLEALVRSQAISAAIHALGDKAFPPSRERSFWAGLALIQARRYAEAVDYLAPLVHSAPRGFAYRPELLQNLAVALHRHGESDRAIVTLEILIADSEMPAAFRQAGRLLAARIEMDRGRLGLARTRLETDAEADSTGSGPEANPVWSPEFQFERDLLLGQIALKQERFDDASQAFTEVAESARDSLTVERAQLGLIDESLAQGQLRQAEQRLRAFLDARADSPLIADAFQRLSQLGSPQIPSLRRQLESWSTDVTYPNRRAYALFYRAILARDVGNAESAVANLGDFLADFPRHPLRESAQIQLIDGLIETGRLTEADRELKRLQQRAALPSTRLRLSLLESRLAEARDETADSLRGFQNVAKSSGVPLESRKAAAYNGALAATASGDEEFYESFAADLAELARDDPEMAGDLLLEVGLYEAREAMPRAFETLENFVLQFPEHPRLADAQITLAEMYLNQVPPQAVSAREHLETAQDDPLTLQQREWLDYVAIWVEISAALNLEAIAKADRFLRDWPRSERRPSVYLLLGESYFKAGEFANAVRALETLATESPESPLAEPALFFAARAAADSLDPEQRPKAIELWSRVAESEHDLADAARHELGLLHLSLEQFDDAVTAFELVIAAENVDPSLQIAALADKGETLFVQASLMESGNEPLLETAAAAFEEAGNHEAASKSWRLQTAVRRGKCLEALGKTDEALALYEEIVEDGAPAGPVAAAPTLEFDWYYRAGLAAIRLLQAAGNQKQAVAVADQVAQAGGPRAAEASEIADRLRLRHFIWQDPAG